MTTTDDRAAIDDLVHQRRDLWLKRYRLADELDAVDAALAAVEADLARRVSALAGATMRQRPSVERNPE
jgi:hypothetical protein